MSAKEKVAVTGASGFIGRNLTQSLVENNYNVNVLGHKNSIKKNSFIKLVNGDLMSSRGLGEFLDEVECVVHLASVLNGPRGEIYRFNITSTMNLLSSAKNIKKIVFISSAGVYGKPGSRPFKEVDLLNPDNEYARSKVDCESEIIRWAEDNGAQYVILRPFNIYGPGSDHGVVASILKSIEKDGKVIINGDPEQITRDFLYVQDFVEVLLLALKEEVSGIYNVGWGRNHSLAELVGLLRKYSKKEFEIETKLSDPTKSGNIEINVDKIKKEFAWKPRVDLEEGVRRTIKWFLTERK